MSKRMWRKNGEIISVKNRKGYFDVMYGSQSISQSLDIFLPEGQGPFPVIISIHGGGYIACDKRQSEMITPMLEGLKKGYAVVGLNYRLSGETSFPEPVRDIKQAIRFLKANATSFQLDENKVVCWGGSAGGYMSVMASLFEHDKYYDNEQDPNIHVSAKIQGAIGWYPQTDMLSTEEELKINSIINHNLSVGCDDVSEEYEPAFPIMEEYEFPFHESKGGVLEMFLGVPLLSGDERIKKASPIYNIHKDIPPMFIQHGSKDEILPMQQSIRFAIKANELIKEERITLEILPGAIHSSVLFETKENLEKVFEFIHRILK